MAEDEMTEPGEITNYSFGGRYIYTVFTNKYYYMITSDSADDAIKKIISLHGDFFKDAKAKAFKSYQFNSIFINKYNLIHFSEFTK